jgi:hypothetical protein
MDELLPDEISVIRDSVNRFMETEVNPMMDEIKQRGEFPRDLVKKAGAGGRALSRVLCTFVRK